MDLEKIKDIKNLLEEIEKNFDKYNCKELKELDKTLRKRIKYLVGVKNHCQNHKLEDTETVQILIKEVRKMGNRILTRIKKLEEISYKDSVRPINNRNKEDNEMKSILNGAFSEEEKIKRLEAFALEISMMMEGTRKQMDEQKLELTQKIDCLKNDSHKLSVCKKILKTKKGNYPAVLKDIEFILKSDLSIEEKMESLDEKLVEIHMDIRSLSIQKDLLEKENLLELRRQKDLLQMCKTLLIQLKNKNITSKHSKSISSKEKKGKENNYYYFILEELLKSEQNYFLIQKLVENKNFLNAHFKKEETKSHVVFAILNHFIESVKLDLENDQNANYFYEVLKLFLNSDLDLTNKEKRKLQKEIEKAEKYLQNTPYCLQNLSNISLNSKSEENMEDMQIPFLQRLLEHAVQYKERVNLKKDYLEAVSLEIAKFKEDHFLKTNSLPDQETIKEILNIPMASIRNSEYVGDTFILENGKYAFSFSYDKEFNLYFRIHMLDTSFIPEESIWYKQMQMHGVAIPKCFKKILKFKKDRSYPAMTYQFKISKKGEVNSFTFFESSIKIDQEITKPELLLYRESEELKNFIGCIKFMALYYNLDFPYVQNSTIESVMDQVLNIELKHYFEKFQLPTLYFVEIKFSEEEKMAVHSSICYFLSKISKEEARKVITILDEVSTFYSCDSSFDGNILLDARTFIGYSQLRILKSYLKGTFTEEKKKDYLKIFECIEKQLNSGRTFMIKGNERKLEKEKRG